MARGSEVFRTVNDAPEVVRRTVPRGDRIDVQRDHPRDRSQEHSALARVTSGGRGRMRTARTVDGHH